MSSEEGSTNTRYDPCCDSETKIIGVIDSNRKTNTFVICKQNRYFNLLVANGNRDIDYENIQNDVSNLLKYGNIAFHFPFSFYSPENQAFNGEHPFILTDFIPGITLKDILVLCKEYRKYLKPYIKYQILLGIAKGLSDLHNIVHRGIVPSKIIIDPDFHPHITHYIQPIDSTITVDIHGQDNFCPPEASQRLYDEPTTKYDIYTFGGIIFQMITNNEPFEDSEYSCPLEQATALGKVDDRFQDRILDDDQQLYQIVQSNCWKFDPEERIDIDTLLNLLLQNAQLYITNQNEMQSINEYLNAIQPQQCPPKYIQGTQEKIQQAFDNGFCGVSKEVNSNSFIMRFLEETNIHTSNNTPEEDTNIFLSRFTV